MPPCRWVVYIYIVMVLSLMTPGALGTASSQASDEDKVSFVWAFEALVAEGKVTKQVPVKEDMTLKTGDQLKMFVELRKPCFVYVIHHGARGEIQRLFPYDIQQFTTDYQTSKIYEIPPMMHGSGSTSKQDAKPFMCSLRATLDGPGATACCYAAAQPAEQPLAATNILAELRNLLKQHRASVKPGRPVPIAGNMRQGIEGVEITAPQFYIETFTIEHS